MSSLGYMLVGRTSFGRVALNTTKLTKTPIRFRRWARLVGTSRRKRYNDKNWPYNYDMGKS